MSSEPRVEYSSKTDVGMRRSSNQDSLAARLCDDYAEWQNAGHLFVVADGMGGHSVGDLASRIAIETLPHVYYKFDSDNVPERMAQAVLAANKAVNDRGRENPDFADMGTTCSALSLSAVGAIVGHIGDSRVYRVRGDSVCQLTFDHSLQWEMIRLGRATAENVDLYHPRNVITRCLGPDPHVAVDIEGPFSVRAGDRFVLCSDGLTNDVTDGEIGRIVTLLPPTEASRLLINLTNCRGGADNSTVVVVRVDEYPELSEPTVDEDESEVTAATARVSSRRRSLHVLRQILQWTGTLVLGFGLILLFRADWQFAIGTALAGLCCGLASFLIPRDRSSAEAGPDAGAPVDSGSGSAHRARSPYRVIPREPPQRLLDLLAEVQSELVQAARDSGWTVDFDELKELTRQAVRAQHQDRHEVAIRHRARAIDQLMKELYAHSRGGVRG